MFAQFWLFCPEFAHFWCTFYTPKQCSIVLNLTNIRYVYNHCLFSSRLPKYTKIFYMLYDLYLMVSSSITHFHYLSTLHLVNVFVFLLCMCLHIFVFLLCMCLDVFVFLLCMYLYVFIFLFVCISMHLSFNFLCICISLSFLFVCICMIFVSILYVFVCICVSILYVFVFAFYHSDENGRPG